MAETERTIHDVVIIGAGPAALTAAIYTTREDLDTILLEKGVIGGLAAITDWIDNYPGYAKGVSGGQLADELQGQAERFGAKIQLAEATAITVEDDTIKRVDTTEGPVYGKTVLIATGTDYKKLGVPGEQEFYGRGVHYCATCDGALYRGKRLVVVGGGNSAVQEGLFLTKFASHIDMLVRSELRASDALLHDLQEKNDKITVHLHTTTDQIIGENGQLTKVIGTKDGQPVSFETDGVFVFVGLKPNTLFLQKEPTASILDGQTFITSNTNLETVLPGVFVAGDVHAGSTMQIASAVGEGATAALKIREYLEAHK